MSTGPQHPPGGGWLLVPAAALPDDPGPSTPPAWPEQEWCDGGWTCWHAECVDALDADAGADR